MSQVGLIEIENSHPQIPTSFSSDSGTAIPIANDLSILGTNGISTSGSGKTITVSLGIPLPVSLGGTLRTSLTDGAILVGDGTSAVEMIGPLTDGQLIIGDTSGVSPVASALTAGTGITITNGAGSIEIELSGPIATSFPTDSGTATPAGNLLNILGDSTQGLNTSGSGATVTLTIADASASQKGVQENASGAEAVAGTASNLSVTPFGMEQKLGAATLNGVMIGGGASQQIKATSAMTNGMVAIGSTGATPVAATLTAGAGITVTNGAGSITIDTTGGGFAWSVVTGATQAMVINNGYIGNRATSITFTLPDTAAVGSEVRITNIGAGLPIIAQNAGESINFTASTSTVGAGGTLTAIEQFASIELICVVADTTWNAITSTGNWSIV